MALDYNYSKCKRPHSCTPEEDQVLRLIIESLIWIVRLPDLNDDNLDEWLFRIRFSDEIHGTSWRVRESRKGLRRKLKRWVGLWTNFYDDTREEWMKSQIGILESRCRQV